MIVEKARIADVPHIYKLINYFADKGEMLHRPLSEIYEEIRDFSVVRENDNVLACAALHVNWADLAELKAVAVLQQRQGEGIGRLLSNACLTEAQELGLTSVFLLTYKPEFFDKLGFERADVAKLPRKVWGECYRCVKFPNCDEVAMIWQVQTDGLAQQSAEDPKHVSVLSTLESMMRLGNGRPARGSEE